MGAGPAIVPGKEVLINLNDETGQDLYSVEYKDDVGNWINSFETLPLALEFIKRNSLVCNLESGLRDTRYPYRHPWVTESLAGSKDESEL